MTKCLSVCLLFLCIIIPLQAQDSITLHVVTTTSIIADIAQNVGGDLIALRSLVPTGIDVHTFEALPSDALLLAEADILFVNGLGLEAFLTGLLENVPETEPIVISEGVELLPIDEVEEQVCDVQEESETSENDSHAHESCDPHIWGNPLNALIVVDTIAAAFAAADPTNEAIYYENAESYKEQLLEIDAEIEDLLTAVPDDKRVLVTNHDFLGYFAARYDFTVVGTIIPGSSTLSEPAARDLADLAELIRREAVPAIFTEISDTGRLAEVIALEAGTEVQIIPLYSGTLSAVDEPAATYLDYLLYNAQSIATALSD